MSFSAEVKKELCRIPPAKGCCAVAEGYGMLLLCGTFSHHEIKMSTEHAAVAKRFSMLLAHAFGVQAEAVQSGARCHVQVENEAYLRRIFSSLGYDYKNNLRYHLNRNMVEKDCCTAAFLRGMFLIGGTVASPESKSHLEIKTGHQSLCREVMSLMLDINMAPKMTQRRASTLVYFKDAERVENFLAFIGAQHASMKMMEAKIEKTVRNRINRQVNFETANLVKTTDASVRQVSAILRAGGADAFPENLQETVRLRLENRESSLEELAAMHNPPMSKPGLSHRMRKIMQIAQAKIPEES